MTQVQKLERLLTRKRGVTAMEIIAAIGTVSPHKRMSEMKARGWVIWREEVPGKSYGIYKGYRAA